MKSSRRYWCCLSKDVVEHFQLKITNSCDEKIITVYEPFVTVHALYVNRIELRDFTGA